MTIRLDKALASKTILNKRGSPQVTAVMLLEEIVSQYQLELREDTNNNGNQLLYSPLEGGLKINYQYFTDKFGYGYFSIVRIALPSISDPVDMKPRKSIVVVTFISGVFSIYTQGSNNS